MRRRHVGNDDESEVNVTSLIDVVFILLIFFLVTASFTKESGIEVVRTRATTAEPQEQASIFIGLSASGEVWIDQRAVDVRAVRPNLERLLATNPQGTVVIQADARSQNGLLVQVMDQARLAGARHIALAAAPDR